MVIICEIDEDNTIHVYLKDATGGMTPGDEGIVLTGWKDYAKKKFTKASDAVIDKLASLIPYMANKIVKVADQINPKPSEWSCEMGIEFTGEENVFILKATEKADMKVTFTWKNQ